MAKAMAVHADLKTTEGFKRASATTTVPISGYYDTVVSPEMFVINGMIHRFLS